MHKARERATGRLFALKQMYMDVVDGKPRLPQYAEREIAALRALLHENVMELLDVREKVRHGRERLCMMHLDQTALSAAGVSGS